MRIPNTFTMACVATMLCLGLMPGWQVQAQTGYVWALSMGGPQYRDYCMDATCDAHGQIYVCGEFDDTTSFGGTVYNSMGFGDMFNCKFDPAGNYVWTLQQASTADDRNFSVDIGADGHIYSCGYGRVPYPQRTLGLHQFDAITTRIRPDGTVAWGRAMQGDIYSEAHDIAVDAAGNSYTVGELETDGWYDTDTLHGHGLKDAFIVKFDSSGTLLWAKALGGSQNDFAHTVDVDAQGNVWVGGSFSGVAHFDNTIVVTTGKSDAFIAKFDASGNVLFVKAFTGANDAETFKLAVSADGDCYFTGDFAGTLTFPSTTLTAVDTSDVFYGKLDRNGGVVWARQAGGMDLDLPQDLEIDADENIYLGGFYFGGFDWQWYNHPGTGYDHLFFGKTDSAGTLLMVEASPDTASAFASGIGVDPAQNIIVTGSFGGYIDLGAYHLNAVQFTTDMFVAKYATRTQELAITDVIGTPYCSNDQFQVVFRAWGNFPAGNTFTVELSDANGSFAAPQVVGSLAGSYGDTVYASIPQAIVAGTHYRLRMRASQPVVYSPDNGQDITLDPNTSIPVAIVGDTVLCNGLPVNLAVSAAFVQQVWSTGDTTSAIVVTTPGTVWVEATDSNGCTNRDEVLVIACVGLMDAKEAGFLHLAPNPARAGTSLVIDEGHAGSYELTVVDLQGRVCLRESLSVTGRRTVLPLDLGGWSSGVYLATIQNGQQQVSLRLVVP